MRERIYRIAAVILYLMVLGCLTGFSFRSMLDARGLAAVALGFLLLSLPQVYGWLKGGRKVSGGLGNLIAHNGMMSGYVTGILFLVVHLSDTGRVEDIPGLLGADLRPVLYGLCIYTVFHSGEEENAAKTGRQGEQTAADPVQEAVSYDELYMYYQKSGLTNRETELAILAYRGYSNREIAEECYISEATVKKHMSHIFEKLGITRREELQNRGAHNERRTADMDSTDKKTL